MSARMMPEPFTSVDFDAGASCKAIDEVRSLMVKRLQCEQVTEMLAGF
jgi:hypothetical protein